MRIPRQEERKEKYATPLCASGVDKWKWYHVPDQTMHICI
jgi:hypothetical protein